MPSIVTHHLFAKDCLKDTKLKKNIDIYYIFAQSFDNLFYYKFFIPGQGKKIRKLGNLGQKSKTNEYFLNILDYIKQHQQQNNEELLAYLYGSICHYTLDSNAHPFVIYQAGSMEKSKKYRGNHEKIEVMIDAIMYKKKTNKDLKKAKLANTLLPKQKFSQELINCLNETFQKTFNFPNIGQIYQKSYLTGHFILKYFVTDTTGIKKKIYQIKDHFGHDKMYQYLSFNINKLNYTYLNLEKKEWNYPTDKKLKRNSSFLEIYEQAQKEAKKLFKISEQYLNNQITKDEVQKEFQNKSYITGLEWTKNDELKYFQY